MLGRHPHQGSGFVGRPRQRDKRGRLPVGVGRAGLADLTTGGKQVFPYNV